MNNCEKSSTGKIKKPKHITQSPRDAHRSRKASLKWLIILGYLIYLLMIVMTQLPFIAEHVSNRAVYDGDPIESHLKFTNDGRQTHYYIERENKSLPGTIDVYYYPKDNTLYTNVINIKSLTIYCRSMYYDECKDVFGIDPFDNSNYYKWYFIEKNHLAVVITSECDLEMLKFVDAPKPNTVSVDGLNWAEGKEYQYISSEGIALSNIPSGSTNVDIYFKPTDIDVKGPVAVISGSRNKIQVNEELKLDGSGSYDPNPGIEIINYVWDFGEGNFTSGKNNVTYQYTKSGIYGIILTVVNTDLNIDQAYFNVSVTDFSEFRIYGSVPHISIKEDSPTWTHDLRFHEPFSEEPDDNYFWYLTGEDIILYSVAGENSSYDQIMITPIMNQFGNDLVTLWLVNGKGDKISQPLWINITPVNDPPTIFGIPDITIHYDVPYQFNYLLYIQDVDTPRDKLVLNTSDPKYTTVNDFNVTYNYPKSMLGLTEYVVLTIWDGKSESSDVVGVWITDDWVPNLVEPLPNVYLDEGEVHLNYFDLDDYFMDPDNDTLYYSYGYTHVNVMINPNHQVDFYAPDDWNGEEMTTFRATDPSGALVEDIITVVVRPINDPPIIRNVPDLIVRYEQDYAFDVSPYIYDEDTPMEDLMLTTSDPTHISIAPDNHLKIILNYPFQPNIPYTNMVTLTVSDGENSSYQKITVFVKDNQPPVIAKPFKEIIMYEDKPKLNILNFYDYFEDSDSSMLYFKVLNIDKVSAKVNVNGSLDLSSAPNWSGREEITFRAIDPDLAFAEAIVDVSILPVNDVPVLLELPIQRFNESEKYKLDLLPYLFDIDNNITQLEIWLLDCEIECEVHGTDIIFYATEPTTTTATIVVSDGYAETSQKILLEVSGEGPSQESLFVELLALVIVIIIMLAGILGVVYRNYRGSYEVLELFLIYQNGLMVLHQSNYNIQRDETDADIISAMFTAVQDFTRDSFAKGDVTDEDWSLKKLEFQGNNILIERGEFMYLAIVFSGKPGKKLGNELRLMRKDIEADYANVLPDWKGDLDDLNGVEDIIERYHLITKPKVQDTPEDFSEILHEESKPKSH